jgi:hypothetical protein
LESMWETEKIINMWSNKIPNFIIKTKESAWLKSNLKI